MIWKFYFYVTSKHPFVGNNLQIIFPIEHRIEINNTVAIEPAEAESGHTEKGIFKIVYDLTGDDPNVLFQHSLMSTIKYLNILSLLSNHGLKEIDAYFFSIVNEDNKSVDKRKLKEFEETLSKEPISTLSHKINNFESLARDAWMYTQNLTNIEEQQSEICCKLENSLSLLRLSYFEIDERVRYIIRFTSLECLVSQKKIEIDTSLLAEIIQHIRYIAKKSNIPDDITDKMCTNIGHSKNESIPNSIKRTLRECSISIPNGFNLTINDLYKARCKTVHAGINVPNLSNYSECLLYILIPLLRQFLYKYLRK